MRPLYEGHVDNIGRIGVYRSKAAAVKAVRATIRNSARADNHGYVLRDDGELVVEVGHQREE